MAVKIVKCCCGVCSCERSLKMVQENTELKKKWSSSVEWLTDELERVRYYAGSELRLADAASFAVGIRCLLLYVQRPSYHANAQYGYNNWSPPAQSNETSNG